MKKKLLAFYVKLGLAVGVPVLGVAAAVAISNNNSEVEYREIDILSDDEEEIGETLKEMEGKLANEENTNKDVIANKTNVNEENVDKSSPYKVLENETNGEGMADVLIESSTEEESEKVTEKVTEEVKYSYDLLGRVVKAEYKDYTLEYVYDKNGNILDINKVLK